MATQFAPDVLVLDPLNRELEQFLAAGGARTTRASAAVLDDLVQSRAQIPDVVVVDIRGTRTIPPSMAKVKREHPELGFLVVASDSDPAMLLDAMRAGATEFVQEPVTLAALEQAMARLVAPRAAQATRGQVFVFVGAKGGVGTTMAAINVATALATLSKSPTLLIDLHVAYGDAALFLGAEPRFSWLDALENMHRLDAEFLKSLVVRTGSGLDILASANRPAGAPIDVRRAKEIVQLASSQYAYVVLDVPGMDAAVLDSLDQANRVVVVANQELATVRNAGRMTAALRSRYPNARVTTVINRCDARAEITRRDVEHAVGGGITHELPSDYRRALTAMHTGHPLALDTHSPLSASIRALARELAGIERAATKKASGGLKALLSGRR